MNIETLQLKPTSVGLKNTVLHFVFFNLFCHVEKSNAAAQCKGKGG